MWTSVRGMRAVHKAVVNSFPVIPDGQGEYVAVSSMMRV